MRTSTADCPHSPHVHALLVVLPNLVVFVNDVNHRAMRVLRQFLDDDIVSSSRIIALVLSDEGIQTHILLHHCVVYHDTWKHILIKKLDSIQKLNASFWLRQGSKIVHVGLGTDLALVNTFGLAKSSMKDWQKVSHCVQCMSRSNHLRKQCMQEGRRGRIYLDHWVLSKSGLCP